MSFYVTARPGPEYSKYAGAAVLAPDNSQQSDMRRLAGTFLNSDNLMPNDKSYPFMGVIYYLAKDLARIFLSRICSSERLMYCISKSLETLQEF